MPSRSVTIVMGAGATGAGVAALGKLFNDIAAGFSDARPLTNELDKTKRSLMGDLTAVVPDSDLSGDRKGPLGVKQTAKAGRKGPELGLQATGPWQLIEYNTRPHAIRARNARQLRMSSGGYATRVNHPGTRGKAIWRRNVDKANPKLEEAGNQIIENAISLTAATAGIGIGVSLLGSAFKRGIL